MDITFIVPVPSSSYEHGFFHLPRLGPIYLGTILKNAGHNVRIISEVFEEIDISKINSDIVCISILTWSANKGYEIAKKIKTLNPLICRSIAV